MRTASPDQGKTPPRKPRQPVNKVNLGPTPETRNPHPLAELLADAIAIAIARPDVIAAMRSIFAPPTEVRDPDRLLSGPELCAALGVSPATLGRLGPPRACRSPIRYDLGEGRGWLATRPGKAAAAAYVDTVDVSNVLRTNGLRAVGGAK
jgi:hypothetical protein